MELSPAWWRAAIALLACVAFLVGGIALLAVGLTGWQVIDAGAAGDLQTRAVSLVIGGLFACGAAMMAARAGGVRRRARVVVSGDGVELVAPGVPDRPVRIPWPAIATIGVEGDGAGGGAAPVLPGRARLLITLRSRPASDAVLELLESEPGRIVYRLDGFDIPAVRRTVNGFALRCHDPVT
ncbi:hypothetical protein [Pseudonocardia sediminis]|uniref:hypothetical protein n=1 Tax=Pseudonocardia sediminis TaxID=1397368 RepID=UPI001028ED1C|nr:hypothetical protein [Pseudonocardia sediminis]